MNVIEQHYRAHRDKLVAFYSRSLGWHDAEDAIQEAYCRALQYLNKPLSYEEFSQWMSSIIKNSVKDSLKDKHNRGQTVSDVSVFIDDDVQHHSPEEEFLCKEKAETIRDIIEGRKSPEKEVLSLYFIYFVGYEGIRNIVPGVNYGYIRKMVSSFRKELCNE